jgi:hypothetical protein
LLLRSGEIELRINRLRDLREIHEPA